MVCQLVGALILCESCMPYILEPMDTDAEVSQQERAWLFERFGTFLRSMCLAHSFEIDLNPPQVHLRDHVLVAAGPGRCAL